jgi:large subunit ribosomal protein L4
MAVKYENITEIPELTVESVNYGHISLAYRRQRRLASPRMAKTLKKHEVDLTSAKWFRQKGTGRARQGARSNPHMRGGGVVFGPIPCEHASKLNRKVRRSALQSALLFHVEGGSVKVLKGDEFAGFSKTKDAYNALLKSGFEGRGLVIVQREAPVLRALRNISGIIILSPDRLNVVDLVDCNFVIFTEQAFAEARMHISGAVGTDEFAEAAGDEQTSTEGGASNG